MDQNNVSTFKLSKLHFILLVFYPNLCACLHSLIQNLSWKHLTAGGWQQSYNIYRVTQVYKSVMSCDKQQEFRATETLFKILLEGFPVLMPTKR
jgi:hypothetical protein